MQRRRPTAGAVAAVLAAVVGACHSASGPTTADEARVLLRSAIEAHGGRAALAQLDNMRIVSTGRFKGTLPFRRTVDVRGTDWSMTIAFLRGATMRVGIVGGRCWQSERHLTALCSEGERRENARIAALHNARLLHHIDEAQVEPAGIVDVAGRACPAIRVGDRLLAFDPVSHLLAQVRIEDRVDTLSDYRTVNGIQVATHRVLTIGGDLDVDDTWTEIVPGGADTQALRVPELPHDGQTVDETDAERPVAWMEIDGAPHDLRALVGRLDAFIRARGRNVSNSDGVILTAPDDNAPGAGWRLAVGVEGGEALVNVVENGLHLETWPAARIVGVFYRGDPLETEDKRTALRTFMREHDLVPSNGARWQILFPREDIDKPPAARLSFLRIAVR